MTLTKAHLSLKAGDRSLGMRTVKNLLACLKITTGIEVTNGAASGHKEQGRTGWEISEIDFRVIGFEVLV